VDRNETAVESVAAVLLGEIYEDLVEDDPFWLLMATTKPASEAKTSQARLDKRG